MPEFKNSNSGSQPLKPAGPFLNPETQMLQEEPWVPPTAPILPTSPHEPTLPPGTSGSVAGASEEALEPLTPKQQKLAGQVQGLYFSLSLIAGFFSPFAGKALMVTAGELSESHVRMGRHIPGYLDWLEKITAYNDFVPFITSHLALVGAIMTHHNLAPEPAKEHFEVLGAPIIQKVAVLEALEEQARQAASNGHNTAYNLPAMA
jgi:hypothetical protein